MPKRSRPSTPATQPRKRSKSRRKAAWSAKRSGSRKRTRRPTKRNAKGVSKPVRQAIAKAMDARIPDTRVVLHCPSVVIPRQWKGLTVGDYNTPVPTRFHFFLHDPSQRASTTVYPGINLPEQLGLRHLPDRTDIAKMTLAQLTGSRVKVKSVYIKGRYYIDQPKMETRGLTDIHIRTLVLEDKTRPYEELIRNMNVPLYVDTGATDFDARAGIGFKINRDETGFTTEQREGRQYSGYLYPNTTKLCRSYTDMYSMKLPLNSESFKVLGKTQRHARIADWKPVYAPTGYLIETTNSGIGRATYQPGPDNGGGITASCPKGGSWSIPFKIPIKHPSYLRWDNVHKRILFPDTTNTRENVDAVDETSGPQNFTPFLCTHLFSPNPAFNDGSVDCDDIVRMEYKIYFTVDAQPKT